jgi:hypothetical protein
MNIHGWGFGQSWYEPRLDEAEVERARRTSSWRSTRLRLVERGETADGSRLPRGTSRRGSGETHPRSTHL